MNAPQEPWDDARLEAAFAAAAGAAQSPEGLSASTIDAIRPRTESRWSWRHPLPIVGLIGALVAVVAVIAIPSIPQAIIGTAPPDASPSATSAPEASEAPRLGTWQLDGITVVDRTGTLTGIRRPTDRERSLDPNMVRGTTVLSSTEALVRWGSSGCMVSTMVLDQMDPPVVSVEFERNDTEPICAKPRPGGALVLAAIVLQASRPLDGIALDDDPTHLPPQEVLGLSVIDVPAAIAQRDATDDASELAVRGWYAPTYPVPCPFTPTTSPVQPACPDDQVLLLAEPETLATVGTNAAGTRTTGFRSPEGPALQIDLDDVDRSWSPTLFDSSPPEPIEVVALGHFADDRSAFCSPETVGLCRDRFVVDRVVWADGREVPMSPLVDPAAAVSTVEDVLSAVRDAAGEHPVLAVMRIQGPDIRRAEPALANHLELIARDGIWVARILVEGATERYLVIDGADAVYSVDGTAVTRVAGTPLSDLPHAQPDPDLDFPTEVAGLPVADVAAAIEVRAVAGDDRELAVRGWYYPIIRRGPACFPDRPAPFVLGICAASIDGRLGSGATDTVEPIMRVTLPPGIRPAEGVPVVFVGHFDDRRSSACGGDASERTCADIFVVDSAWVDGGLPSPDWTWPSASPPLGPEAMAEFVTRTFAAIAGDEATVLSVGAIPGADVNDLEPAVGAAMSGARWVWHATVLSGDRVRTFLIADDDAVARREGRSNEWWEVVGDQVTGTGADIN